MTREVLLSYVASLDKRMWFLFREADAIVIETRDTLSDEFQIAAEIVSVFERLAKQRVEES